MMAKRPSNKSQQPQFKETVKEDDKKSVNNSQLNESKESQQNIPQSQQSQQQQQQQNNSKFDLPNIPKFQSLQLRDYFDAKLSAVLLEGLKELGRQRPENPVKFLGEYLIKQSESQ